MSSNYYIGRNTPETMVGGMKKWEEFAQSAGRNSLEPFGDGFKVSPRRTATPYNGPELHPEADGEEDDEYTDEQHYSESEFYTEQEEDEPESDEGTRRYEVTAGRPKDFESDSHLLHIDFISDELERFELPGRGPNHSQRRPHGKKLPATSQQQHNMSFSRDRVREIERNNHILLQRILSTKPTLRTQPSKPAKSNSSLNNSRVTSGALNRRKHQRKIAGENEILLQKITSIAVSKRASC
ncbi:uncharacterized protein LOC128726768 [Anopheles nili]|uniref:uncharacterized protein LOC128726768 n=1 Tax=Anopheles nili TaxID=185578 RepID=UPI00237AA2A4|nr:uncharacterized protein LOC128726768 [Anopheles nili]